MGSETWIKSKLSSIYAQGFGKIPSTPLDIGLGLGKNPPNSSSRVLWGKSLKWFYCHDIHMDWSFTISSIKKCWSFMTKLTLAIPIHLTSSYGCLLRAVTITSLTPTGTTVSVLSIAWRISSSIPPSWCHKKSTIRSGHNRRSYILKLFKIRMSCNPQYTMGEAQSLVMEEKGNGWV